MINMSPLSAIPALNPCSARPIATAAGVAVLAVCLQGCPRFPIYFSGWRSPVWVVLGLLLLALAIVAIALLLIRAPGGRSGRIPIFRSRFPSSARSRLGRGVSGAARAEGSGSVLPGPPSLLFPPSHHEKLHDSTYLGRILEAEEESLRQAQRHSGQEDAPPSSGQRHSHPDDDEFAP